jgi:dUTP pyrophosphatase
MTLTLKIKPIDEYAKIPHYANEGDAGMGLYSVEEKIIYPGETV